MLYQTGIAYYEKNGSYTEESINNKKKIISIILSIICSLSLFIIIYKIIIISSNILDNSLKPLP